MEIETSFDTSDNQPSGINFGNFHQFQNQGTMAMENGNQGQIFEIEEKPLIGNCFNVVEDPFKHDEQVEEEEDDEEFEPPLEDEYIAEEYLDMDYIEDQPEMINQELEEVTNGFEEEKFAQYLKERNNY